MIETTVTSASLTSLSHCETSHVKPSINRSESQPILITSSDLFSDKNTFDEINHSFPNSSKSSIRFDESESNGSNEVIRSVIDCLLCPLVSTKEVCLYICQIPACLCLSTAICLFCGFAARIRCKWFTASLIHRNVDKLISIRCVVIWDRICCQNFFNKLWRLWSLTVVELCNRFASQSIHEFSQRFPDLSS